MLGSDSKGSTPLLTLLEVCQTVIPRHPSISPWYDMRGMISKSISSCYDVKRMISESAVRTRTGTVIGTVIGAVAGVETGAKTGDMKNDRFQGGVVSDSDLTTLFVIIEDDWNKKKVAK